MDIINNRLRAANGANRRKARASVSTAPHFLIVPKTASPDPQAKPAASADHICPCSGPPASLDTL